MTRTLTLQDIASLAGVSRQAVTNWRRRPTVQGAVVTFPLPVETIDGVARFARADVVKYLEASNRGKNADAEVEVTTFSVPDGDRLDDVVTLLALRKVVGEDLVSQSPADLLAVAGEVDPEDRFLLTEVRELADDQHLMSYVDELVAGSFGPPDALDRVYGSRLARIGNVRGLDGMVIDLLAELANVTRVHLGADDVWIDLGLHPEARRVANGFAGAHVGEGDGVRRMLRHLLIDGVEPGTGSTATVRVVSVVGQGDYDALNWIEDKVVNELAESEIAIVVGPSSALCDRLRGDNRSLRSDILKLGGLVAAFRLPRGMWKEAHRQSLGLWILQGGVQRDGTVVADLMSMTPDVSDLGSDVAGSLEQTGARQYRYARAVRYADVWTKDTVVPPGALAAPTIPTTLNDVGRKVVSATLVTRERLSGFDVDALSVEPRGVSSSDTLGQLQGERKPRVRMINGSRIKPEHAETFGTSRVLSAGSGIELRIDPLVAAEHYPNAARTEPGDVVFVERPRPSAIVDTAGGALVQTPSRILRLSKDKYAGIGSFALAAVINSLHDDAREWTTWSIPRLTVERAEELELVLADAHAYTTELHLKEVAMKGLISNLVQGVASGALVISPTTSKKAG